MTPTTIGLGLVALLLSVQVAHARPTPEQKCQAGKNIAAAKLAACLQNAEAKLVTKGDQGKYAQAKLDCSYKFATSWLKLEAAAARAGATCPDVPLDQSALEAAIRQCSTSVASALAGGGLSDCTASLGTCLGDLDASQAARSACEANLTAAQNELAGCQAELSACNLVTPTPTPSPTMTPTPTSTPIPRFVDNGDGTVTDNQTGLMWEKKTTTPGPAMNYADPHELKNAYTWTATLGGTPPDGTVFTDFLAKLNGAMLTACFADHCDWRLPTIEELQMILLQPYPCGTFPCIDPIFGPAANNRTWTATTNGPDSAFVVNFGTAYVDWIGKNSGVYARAVRTIQ